MAAFIHSPIGNRIGAPASGTATFPTPFNATIGAPASGTATIQKLVQECSPPLTRTLPIVKVQEIRSTCVLVTQLA